MTDLASAEYDTGRDVGSKPFGWCHPTDISRSRLDGGPLHYKTRLFNTKAMGRDTIAASLL
jgi:hypothetical protein